MTRYFFLTVFCFLQLFLANSQTVTIQATATDYAGEPVYFMQYADLLTQTPQRLAQAAFDADGRLQAELPVSHTRLIYFDIGAVRALLYVEPGKSYKLVLPPRIELTEADKINPFFRRDEVYIGIKDADRYELNHLISDFNYRYNAYLSQNYLKILQLGYKSNISELTHALDSLYAEVNNPYFESYKAYKYAALKHLAYVRNNEAMQRKFFGNSPVHYHNAAYMNLFNSIFENFLVLYSKTEKGAEIFVDLVNKRSFATLKKTVRDWGILQNDSIIELAILKGIYDGFYNRTYPREAVMEVLDSVRVHSLIPESRLIAENIKIRAKLLTPGFPAPEFTLSSAHSGEVSLRSLSGKFVYLSFINLNSATCVQELELLEVFHEKYPEYFQVVSIATDTDFEAVKKHFKTQGYAWKLLSYQQYPEILDLYNVRVYPSYYLISPEGNLRLTPAPSPADNFEEQFGVVWREYKNQQRRKEYRDD